MAAGFAQHLAPWDSCLIKPASEAKALPQVRRPSDEYCIKFSDPHWRIKLDLLKELITSDYSKEEMDAAVTRAAHRALTQDNS